MVHITHVFALVSLPLAFSLPAEKRAATPTVSLAYATVVGSSSNNIDSFNGIPFAQPPVGQLRLKPPQPISSNLGTLQATGSAKECPQLSSATSASPAATSAINPDLMSDYTKALEIAQSPGNSLNKRQTTTTESEDCLTLNVQRPAGLNSTAKLPVMYYIFGGAFETGSSNMDNTEFITSSVTEGHPLIVVNVNYRVNGFGFLGGKDLLDERSTNLGLLDQRAGLEWVADNIEAFGGDASKVTIQGGSAGSISVFDQMALYGGDNTYKGKALFRGAIMNSGSVIPADLVDGPKGQHIYDTVVAAAGCTGAADRLACLRSLDYATFHNAVNSVPSSVGYNSIALSYLPRPDGKALPESPELLAQAGRYTQVPFLIGDQEDEGTLFSLFQTNITNTDQLVDYFSTVFFPRTDRSLVEELVAQYPDDPSAGSPFRTGIFNSLYPQYKRLAAILGDIAFTLARRFFLETANSVYPDVPAWSYLASYDYGFPLLGTYHGSNSVDSVGLTLGGGPQRAFEKYYISFINSLDPNSLQTNAANWPQYKDDAQLLQLNLLSDNLLADDFRKNASDFLAGNMAAFRL
jgi:carboxylesterase type B